MKMGHKVSIICASRSRIKELLPAINFMPFGLKTDYCTQISIDADVVHLMQIPADCALPDKPYIYTQPCPLSFRYVVSTPIGD